MSKDYRSPKTWLGSEDENVLKLLSELMETVAELATICASHTHRVKNTGQPYLFDVSH